VDISNQLKNVGQGTVINYDGQNYFALERLKYVTNIFTENALVTELIITPYYFFDEKMMELYDYSLSIRVVESISSKDNFLLEETGKKSIEEIDLEVIEKINNTYFEVKEGDLQTFLKSLEQYLRFMRKNEPHLLIQIRKELSSQDINNDGIYYELT
jgi:hypothetical protein